MDMEQRKRQNFRNKNKEATKCQYNKKLINLREMHGQMVTTNNRKNTIGRKKENRGRGYKVKQRNNLPDVKIKITPSNDVKN